MISNRISYELNEQVVAQIIEHIDAIMVLMPFLIGLTPQQRQHLNSAGDGSQAFIRKSASVAPMITDYLPGGLNIAEMNKDIALMDALQPIRVKAESLAEKISDTQAILSSEAWEASLHIYRAAKQAQGPMGIEDAVRDLARRFARASSSDTTESTEPTTEPQPQE